MPATPLPPDLKEAAKAAQKIHSLDPVPFEYDDTGMADRLQARVHGRFLYNRQDNKTMYFDGSVWHEDTTAQLEQRFDEAANAISREPALYAPTGDKETDDKGITEARRAKAKFLKHSRTARGKRDGISQFKDRITVPRDTFDRDYNLLNTPGGVIDREDIAAGIKPHTPAQRLSKITHGTPSPKSQAPRWLQFISEITEGDTEIASFLQRAVGYSVFGRAAERKAFIIHGVGEKGNGSNGKSTFTKTIGKVLGDYASKLKSSVFMAKSFATDSGRATPELMHFDGGRWLYASETNEGDKLDVATIKELTSLEPIIIRGLRQEERQVDVVGTLWLTTNHRPVVESEEEATWGRIVFIPFTATFEHQELDLGEYMANQEADGIMQWIVEGYQEYLDRGLDIPNSIKANGEDYREDNDVVGAFTADCIIFQDNRWLPAHVVGETYQAWRAESSTTLPPQTFVKQFRVRHKLHAGRLQNSHGFSDMALSTDGQRLHKSHKAK